MAYQAHFARYAFSFDAVEDGSISTASSVIGFPSSRGLQETDFTPEDVDNSDAGWSTDFVLTTLGLCFLISSYTSYHPSKRHFSYMHLGTAIAHLFGGFAHLLFPNRASDGVGMIGFYVTIVLGYAGNCMRYGLGWGLDRCWVHLAGLNFLYLFVAGIFAIVQMEATKDRIDSAPDTADPVLADTVFGYGELLCAIGEIVASIAYVVQRDRSWYAWTAMGSNVIGWVAVYAVGLWAATTNTEYDTRITQLIFHYVMIIFLWAINELGLMPVLSSVEEQEEDVKAPQDAVESSSKVQEEALEETAGAATPNDIEGSSKLQEGDFYEHVDAC